MAVAAFAIGFICSCQVKCCTDKLSDDCLGVNLFEEDFWRVHSLTAEKNLKNVTFKQLSL